MKHLTQNIEVIIANPDLTSENKLEAIGNELVEQQTIYPDEEYDNEELRGTELDPEDFTYEWEEWSFWIETLEDRCDTNIDPIYLEEWLDAWLLSLVRDMHKKANEVTENMLDNFDKLDDCLSINHSGRDKRKFAVMNTPGYETKYHMLPGGWMVASLVKSNSPYTRKVIWNEEGNFEEIVDNDKPDWLIELEQQEAKTKKFKKQEHQMKMLRKEIKDLRRKYKHYYSKYWITKNIDDKKKWDMYYKEYLYYSKAMDNIKKLDEKASVEIKQREANILLHYFVEFQQACPSDVVDSVTREDIKWRYRTTWYYPTLNFLKRCVKRAKELANA